MVRPVTQTLKTTIPFEAGAVKTLSLPTVGYITRVELLLHLNVTTDATNGGTPAEDALARIIKTLRIEVPGGKPYYAIADGRQLKYLNLLDLGRVDEDALPTAAGVTADVYAKYYIVLGWMPENPFDPTVVIPAEKLPQLNLVLQWGSASDLGTGYTINSGEVKVTLRRIELDSWEKESDVWPAGIVIPTFQSETRSISGAVSDLGFQVDLPVGNVIRDILIIVLDTAGNRSDTVVEEVGVTRPSTGETPYRINWLSLIKATAIDHGLAEAIKGVALLDGADVSGVPVGVDLSLAKPGEWVLGFSTSGAGSLLLMYRQYT